MEEAERAEAERKRKEAEEKAAEERRQKEEAERAEAKRKRKEAEAKAAEERRQKEAERAEAERKAKDAFDREFEIKDGVLNKYSGNSWRVNFLDFYRYKYYVQPIVKIGYEAFLNNSQLREIFFTPEKAIDVIGHSAFENCKELIKIGYLNFNQSTLYTPYLNVIKIERYAFRNCEKLVTIRFSSALREIEPYAFEGCTGLEGVTMYGKWRLISSEKLKPSKKINMDNYTGREIGDLIRKYQSYHWLRID